MHRQKQLTNNNNIIIMKKIILTSILLSLTFGLFAQVTVADAQKKLTAAVKNAENPKNEAKVATWLKLADAYYVLYTAEKGMALPGVDRKTNELTIKENLLSEGRAKDKDGVVFTKLVYENHSDYYNRNGVLQYIQVTKDVVANPLGQAAEALAKAAEVDPQGKKAKDINVILNKIAQAHYDDAIFYYQFDDAARSSELFQLAYAVRAQAPLSTIDTSSLNNAAIMATVAGRNTEATKMFEELLSIGFEDQGNVYSKLGTLALERQDTTAMIGYYEQGFTKFPQNQAILIGLINYYLTSGQNPDRLFELVQTAKANEPENASLYYVEGNVYKELKEYDKAYAAYMHANEVSATPYEYGYIGAGQMYYDLAIEYSQKASDEMDYKKYEELSEKCNEALKSAIEPFEKAYETTADPKIKAGVAEYLKNIFYRFSSDSDEMYAKYKKYNEIYKAAQQ